MATTMKAEVRGEYHHPPWSEYSSDYTTPRHHEPAPYPAPSNQIDSHRTCPSSNDQIESHRTYPPPGDQIDSHRGFSHPQALPAPLQTRFLPRHGPEDITSASTSSATPTSGNSLKRPYVEDDAFANATYGNKFQEASLPQGQNASLLCFNDVIEDDAIVDQHGHRRPVAVAAQLSGMFLLSDISNNDESQQPELTCYRRNLFSVTGTVQAPRGPLFLANGRGMVHALEVAIQAVESTEGHDIQMIVIPWKTQPSYAAELSAGAENEPVPIALVPYEVERRVIPGMMEDSTTVYPVVFRRLQFRQATANNGRRKELQQHFLVHLNVMATLGDGRKVKLAESTTRPIIVRGRSPRNFHKKQDIPLAGTAASRGLGPELPAISRNVSLSSHEPDRFATVPDGHRSSIADFETSMMTMPYPAPSTSRTWHIDPSQHSSMPPMGKLPSSVGPTYDVTQVGTGNSINPYMPPITMHGTTSMLPQLRTSFVYEQHLASPPTTDDGTSATGRYPISPQTYAQQPVYQGDGNPRPTKSPRHALTPESQFSPLSAPYGNPLPSSIDTAHTRQFYPRSQPAIDARLLSRSAFEPSMMASDGQHFSYVEPHSSRQNYIAPAADTIWSTS